MLHSIPKCCTKILHSFKCFLLKECESSWMGERSLESKCILTQRHSLKSLLGYPPLDMPYCVPPGRFLRTNSNRIYGCSHIAKILIAMGESLFANLVEIKHLCLGQWRTRWSFCKYQYRESRDITNFDRFIGLPPSAMNNSTVSIQ